MPWGPSDSVQVAFSVTPSSTTVFPPKATSLGGAQVTRALYVGGTSDVTVVMICGASATFSAVQAGSILPIQVTQVVSGSAGAAILGLY
jgi:hypothetical protein